MIRLLKTKHHVGLLLWGLLFVSNSAAAQTQVRYSSVESNLTSLGPDAVKCIGPSAANPCVGALQTFTYDSNGNIETGNDSAGSTNFTYNHDNKLLRSTGPAHTVEYVYGPSGEKVATIENGVTTYFFDNGLEVGAKGDSLSYFFNGERVAIKDHSVPAPKYLLNDYLGSVRAVVDSGGNLLSRNDYYPFGEMMSQTGNSGADSSYEFHGNRIDAGGVIDFNARSMMPGIGRFLQADTVIPDEKDPQSLNRYAYTQNNPLKFRDPSGHAVRYSQLAESSPLLYYSPGFLSSHGVPDSPFEGKAMLFNSANPTAQIAANQSPYLVLLQHGLPFSNEALPQRSIIAALNQNPTTSHFLNQACYGAYSAAQTLLQVPTLEGSGGYFDVHFARLRDIDLHAVDGIWALAAGENSFVDFDGRNTLVGFTGSDARSQASAFAAFSRPAYLAQSLGGASIEPRLWNLSGVAALSIGRGALDLMSGNSNPVRSIGVSMFAGSGAIAGASYGMHGMGRAFTKIFGDHPRAFAIGASLGTILGGSAGYYAGRKVGSATMDLMGVK